MTITKYIPALALAMFFAFLFAACAPERKNIFSKTYHNTTARYNAYFIAKEKLNEVNSALVKNQENNFNKFLTIFPSIDSTTIKGMEEELEDVIKKASLAIQRHKGSEWEDDSYILVGIARYYKAEFTNAIETFKYVNKKSEDDNARHLALVYLMRTFIDFEEINNAIAVSDYLKREKLNKANLKLLHLTRAYLASYHKDYPEMLYHLKLAGPLLKKREGKAKIYFLMGQLEQHLQNDAAAFASYKKCLRSNPEYELSFYAKLNMAQSYDPQKPKDLKKIRKYFTKLLKDAKNKEYKDKIYYELAEFEMKQENLEQAIENYKLSVQSSIGNDRQKSYSYLRLGEIHYEQFKKYQLAKVYYDSTVAVMPKDESLYNATSERQQVLADFVKQFNTVQVQDSLLNLANMDSVSLHAFLDEVIAKKLKEEEERAKKEAAAARKQASASNQPFFGADQGGMPGIKSGDTWYFYNNSQMSTGDTEFRRKWGNIKLEDNWRRSDKRMSDFEDETPSEDEENPLAEIDPEMEEGANKGAVLKEKYLSTIPSTPEAQAKALGLIEKAYFRLGNIYNFKLLEKENASETFTKLINRFPQSEHKPEALYLLYLINKELENDVYEQYKNTILTEFANSIYAKLILNPNFREESDAIEETLQKEYKTAFHFYNQENFKEAQRLVSKVISEHPDHPFTDHFRLLNILLIGKNETIEKYQLSLKEFIENNDDKYLQEHAEKLLKASDDFQKAMTARKGTNYIPYFEQVHNVILVYRNREDITEQITEKINSFINNNFQDKGLNTGSLILDTDNSMILISEFKDKVDALNFYQQLSAEREFEEVEFHKFAITKDNFQIFYKSKDFKSYLSFFEQYYN